MAPSQKTPRTTRKAVAVNPRPPVAINPTPPLAQIPGTMTPGGPKAPGHLPDLPQPPIPRPAERLPAELLMTPAQDASGMAPRVPPSDVMPELARAWVESGRTGLVRYGGWLGEEWLTDLAGTRALQVYREMWDNDATIRALRFTIEMFMRKTPWTVEAAGDDPQDEAAADFVSSCMVDMTHSWNDFLVEVCSMFCFGWAWIEQCFKLRAGPDQTHPLLRSRYDDGFVGWYKLPIRSQESWRRWIWDHETGDLLAFIQAPAPDYRERQIDRWKSLLFRTSKTKDSPEGVSILRGIYRAWWHKKKIENFEGIGIERDMTGIPHMTMPEAVYAAPAGSPLAAVRTLTEQMLSQLKRDERGYVITPPEDSGWKFELIKNAGQRVDPLPAIERYTRDMAASVLGDFILIGHKEQGSRALHENKTKMFLDAISAWNDTIADELNTRGVPLLFYYNRDIPGFPQPVSGLPRFKPGPIESIELSELAPYITALAGVGIDLSSDVDTVNTLLRAARLPERVLVEPDEEAPEEQIGGAGGNDDLASDDQGERAVSKADEHMAALLWKARAERTARGSPKAGAARRDPAVKFDPDQLRDEGGKWSIGGGTGVEPTASARGKLGAQRAYVKHLSPPSRDALQKYTIDGYRQINEDLRAGGLDGQARPRIDEAIAGAPPVPQDISVWRGAGPDDLMVRTQPQARADFVGGTVKDGAFVSTTMSRTRAGLFATEYDTVAHPVVYHITVPKGERVLPLSDVSALRREQEVLLPRGRTYRVLGVSEGHYGAYELQIVHLRMMP